MRPIPSATRRILHHAEDCYSIRGLAQQAGWDCDYVQYSSGKLEAPFDAFLYGGMQFTQQHFNQKLCVQGSPPPDTIPIILFTQSMEEGCFDGRTFGSRDGVFMRSGSDGILHTPRNCRLFTISVSKEYLSRVAWTYDHIDLDRSLHENQVISFQAETLNKLRCFISKAYSSCPSDPASMELHDEILRALSETLRHNHPPETLSLQCSNHNMYVRKAQEYIEHHLKEDLPLTDVATYAGISLRSLELAFRKVLQLSPNEYIRTQRLHRFRAHLLSTNTEELHKIGVIAKQHGLFHVSRSSSQYRKLFGELPSQTLAQRESTAD